MSALLVARATLTSLARTPLWWLFAALLALSWPALRTFLPLGLATSDLHHWTAAYEVAFVGGSLAIVGGLGALGRMTWLMRPIGPIQRTATETFALVVCAIALGAFALVPAHLFHSWQFATFRAGESFAALLLAWTHVAVLATVALRVTLDPIARVAVVVLAVFVVPGLLPGSGPLDRALLSALDAGGTLRATFDFPLSRAHWMMASVPIVGWGAAAIAFASPPDPLRPRHALRDSR